MRRAGKPRKTAFDRQREKVASIRKLIENERDRHSRKIKSLDEQVSVARGFSSKDMMKLALARLDGQRQDEHARHHERKRSLEARLQETLR